MVYCSLQTVQVYPHALDVHNTVNCMGVPFVVWCGVEWSGVRVWCGVVVWWCVWCGVVWCGVVWCDVICDLWWCGVVWCGVVWCGVVWCGVVWCDVM